MLLLLLTIIGCSIMAYVDFVLRPPYMIKSMVKVILFLLLPFCYSMIDPLVNFKKLFKVDKKSLVRSMILGLGVYIIMIIGYLVLKNFIDFSGITTSLEKNIGVSKGNFVFVALYISFINSLLEEFFFRGFTFISLLGLSKRWFAYCYSALLFAIYHIGMMSDWFNPWILVLMIAGLFVSGAFFNYLNEKNQNIYASWAVHMFANFGINTVGFILFGLL